MGFSPALSNQITNFPLKNEFCYSYDDEKGGKYCFFLSLSLSFSFVFLVASNVTKYLLWCTGLLSDEKMCSLVSHYYFCRVWCQLTLIFALIFPSISQGNGAKIQDLMMFVPVGVQVSVIVSFNSTKVSCLFNYSFVCLLTSRQIFIHLRVKRLTVSRSIRRIKFQRFLGNSTCNNHAGGRSM